MPSMTEGFGLVGLEAIAAGTPLLVSGESGLGQLLKEVLEQEQAARIVVDMRGEAQRVQDRWAGHISRMLADRDSSFQRATQVLDLLASSRKWQKSVENLLSALGVNLT